MSRRARRSNRRTPASHPPMPRTSWPPRRPARRRRPGRPRRGRGPGSRDSGGRDRPRPPPRPGVDARAIRRPGVDPGAGQAGAQARAGSPSPSRSAFRSSRRSGPRTGRSRARPSVIADRPPASIAAHDRTALRLHHRRWRLGRLRAGQPPECRSLGRRVLLLEAGRPGLPVRRLHPHAGGPGLPDRQPLLRLAVRVGARAVHARPADLPRPRQGPGRLVEHQRPDLPARQPARLRALGRRPGDGDLGLRPLPALLQADGDLPRRRGRTIRSAATTGRSSSSAGRPTGPLFAAFFAGGPGGRLLADRGRQRLSPGRVRAVRPEHPPGPPAVGRAGLPAAGPWPPEPHRPDADVRDPAWSSTAGARSRSTSSGRAAGRNGSRAARSSSPAGAINTPAAPPALGGRAAAATSSALGIPVVADLPAVGAEPPGPPRGLHPVPVAPARLDAAGARSCGGGRSSAPSGSSCGAAPARPTTSRAVASSAATTTSPIRT